MKLRRVSLVLACLCMAFVTVSWGADPPSPPAPADKADLTAQVESLKKILAKQQEQIESLRAALEEQKKVLEQVGVQAAMPVQHTTPSAALVASTTTVLPPVLATPAPAKTDPLSLGPQAPQQIGPSTNPQERSQLPVSATPLTIHLGDATITPVGFLDLTNVYRSTNSGAGIATNFGSIPYNNTVGGRLIEDRFSAQNSRIGFRVDAMYKDWHILGYYEGDFVGGYGNGAFNTQVTSYSMLYRLRLYWADLRNKKFEMLAGQSWSMMTPNRKGISALPGDLFYGQEYDVNYLNGLTWGRIPGIRFLYHSDGDKLTAGISLENATQYFGGSGGGGVPTPPTALAGLGTSELDDNQANGLALPNVHPDIIAKVATDPNSHIHFEVAGVESTVRIFNPNTKLYFTKAGVGGSINGNFEVAKGVRLITNNFWSDGAGRYMFGQAPNFILGATGQPSLVHSGSTLNGVEATVKNNVFYAYYGNVYIKRNTAVDTNGSLIGYGYTGSPNSQNRDIQEGTVGWNYTIWKDPKYGALSTFLQYAYFFRNPWYVAPGAPKNTHENAVWFDIRYTLPGSAPAIKY
jgi:hypothetical protein